MKNDNYIISKILESQDMTFEVQEAFNYILNVWGIDLNCQYVAWRMNDVQFNKTLPLDIVLNKMAVDEWLVSKDVKDNDSTFVLIKLSD